MNETKENSAFRFSSVVVVFLLTRLALEIVGLLANFYFPPAQAVYRLRDLQYHKRQPAPLEIWARWDSEWYLLIAEQGYAADEYIKNAAGGRYLPQDSAKFFPAYPIAIRCLSFLTRNSVLSGFVISNVFALILIYYFYRLAQKLIDQRNAFYGTLLFIVFPTSFYLNAVYAESLFLAAMVAAFFYVEEKKLIPAVIACVIAVLSRPQGALALPALALLAWYKFEDRRFVAIAALTLALGVPLAGYFLYIEKIFGSMSWIAQSQNYWRGEMKYPLYGLIRFAQGEIAIHGQHNSLIDFTFAMSHLIVLVLSFRRIPIPYAVYSLIVLLFPLSSTLFSFSRLCLANFPFFLILPLLLKRWNLAVQIFSAMLLAFFMAAFANWFFVG
jgi:hypothetical protein